MRHHPFFEDYQWGVVMRDFTEEQDMFRGVYRKFLERV
jgi:hypothetical protein